MNDAEIRAMIEQHWDASDAGDFTVEHVIYHDDAVLEYPQSGERIRGRRNIRECRTAEPGVKRCSVRRIVGAGDFWVSELVLTEGGRRSCSVSIMEFRAGRVMRETRYFAAQIAPGAARSHLVEPID